MLVGGNEVDNELMEALLENLFDSGLIQALAGIIPHAMRWRAGAIAARQITHIAANFLVAECQATWETGIEQDEFCNAPRVQCSGI